MNNPKAERTLTAEELQAIIDGCDKLAHGPWFHGPAEGKNGTAGLAQVDNGAEMWPVIAEWPEAEHIARLDPQTVKAMASMAIQSLSTQQPMGEVRVKPLEWVASDDELGRNNWRFRSVPKIGPAYTITVMVHGQLGERWEVRSLDEHFATLEEAKSAAQADYEARILSALHPNQESGE